jgi:hypothetical protein
MRILYTAQFPDNQGFDIFVCRSAFENKHEIIVIRAIVYTESGRCKWQLLARSSKTHFGITVALQEFSKDLERSMADMTGMENF